MGRPAQYEDRVTTSVRLDRELHAQLLEAAAERDISTNLLVTHALRHYLARLIPVDQIVFVNEEAEQ